MSSTKERIMNKIIDKKGEAGNKGKSLYNFEIIKGSNSKSEHGKLV